ncbi:hypothetical protein GCM10007421_09920 [Halopseudomonas oceani]|uniref:YjiS-like domain-containing protein n=1 Tax=Halopseudomonas oceani TaxID=1708783 RepID=A0A2P4EXF9_9GAMM|nr:DUF1127 domain-containing protein [Halopseudomonas oceani]POB04698.1 hypothetical protein C1949_06955 [Halopseudomonas oceani]GGE38112.1 hypothetical protein GCM10007421_09920 [Halopseudomonas oceani]
MTTGLLQQLRTALRRRRTCRQLLRLDDRMLADVGQSRAELEHELTRPLLTLRRNRSAKCRTAPYHKRLN